MGRKPKFQLRRDVYIEWEISESKAIRRLSAIGIRVLWRFLQKRKWTKMRRRIVYENGDIDFTYAEATFVGIKNTSFYEAVKRLIEVGFIDLDHQTNHISKFLSYGCSVFFFNCKRNICGCTSLDVVWEVY